MPIKSDLYSLTDIVFHVLFSVSVYIGSCDDMLISAASGIYSAISHYSVPMPSHAYRDTIAFRGLSFAYGLVGCAHCFSKGSDDTHR